MRELTLLALLVCATTAAAPVHNELRLVRRTVMKMQPMLTKAEADVIAHSLLKHSRVNGLDWTLMAAILSQESSFRRDPQSCLAKGKACSDLGMSQINWATWSKPLNLNKRRLLKDVDYNIATMASILVLLKTKYGHEKHWESRFHSFTPSHRDIYMSKIGPKYKKIIMFAQRSM